MTIKKLSIKLSILITFFIVISLSACLGEPQSNSAKIVISFGGANRTVYNPNDSATLNKLKHKIVLTSAAETLNFTAAGGTTFEANVAPGNWNLKVVSYLNGDVYAAGEKDVILISGLNNETIAMYQAHLVKFISNGGSAVEEQVIYHAQKIKPDNISTSHPNGLGFVGWYDFMEEPFDFNNNRIFESITLHAKWEESSVSEGNSLGEKLDWIYNNSVDGGNYIVMVNNDESLAPQTLSYSGKSVSITLKSNNTTMKFVTLKDNNNSLFTVGSGVTLTLDSYIVLEGQTNNTSPLVIVEGKLIMSPLSKVIDNKSGQSENENAGGGVLIRGGNFIMNGGEISGNNANQGGGVWVGASGTFTMNGGKISGNNAKIFWGAGGVGVNSGSTFIMNGGEISYNTTTSTIPNKGDNGGGVSVGEGATFIMNDGKIFGNTTTNSGGGFYMYKGTFTMNGGEIYGNNAKNGGGVCVNGGTFTMKGGKISGNKAEGTVTDPKSYYCGGGVNVFENGTFIMSNGEISYNNADDNGGGVSVDGTFIMNGGNIHNNYADFGGGVSVYNGIFNKTADPNTGGTIKENNTKDVWNGKTVWADRPNSNSDNTLARRKNDILKNEALSYNATIRVPASGRWNDDQ